MLTKIPIEIIYGNGKSNKFVTFDGVNMEISNISIEASTKIGKIVYNKSLGNLTISIVPYSIDVNNKTLVNNNILDTIVVPGFVRVSNLRRGRQGNFGKDGTDGINGAPNVNGKKGNIGLEGFRGLRGVDGLPGPRGYSGSRGLKGFKGKTGVQGTIGPKGKRGNLGNAGQKGTSGANDYINIVVSDTDPGTIGAGSLWVKPTNFVYGNDIVNFTVTNVKEDVTCSNTLATINALYNGEIVEDYTWRNLKFTFCVNLCGKYLDCCVDNDGRLIIIANVPSIDGMTTVMYRDSEIINLNVHFLSAKCTFSNGLFVADDNTLLIHNLNLKITLPGYNVKFIFAQNDVLMFCCKEGLFLYDYSTRQLMLKYPGDFDDGFFAGDKVYANFEGQTYYNTVNFDCEKIIAQNCIQIDGAVYLISQVDSTLNLYSHDGSLHYSCNAVKQKRIAYKQNSAYAITTFGLKHITDYNNCDYVSPYKIEYTDNAIFAEAI